MNFHAELTSALEQQRVERLAPSLKAAPRSVRIPTKRFEAQGLRAPLDPVAFVTWKFCGEHSFEDAELTEDGLHAGMQRFTRAMARESLRFKERDLQAALRTVDGGGATGRTAAQH